MSLLREHDGLMYLLPNISPATSGRLKILVFDHRRFVDSIVLAFPNDSLLHPRGTVHDFDVHGDTIAVLYFGAVLMYVRQPGGAFGAPRITAIPRYYEFLSIAGQTMYLTACDPQALTIVEHPCWIGALPIGAATMRDSFRLPIPEGLQFMPFLPRRILSFNEGGILLGDVTRYHIRLCDTHGRVLDSLVRNDGPWTRLPDSGYRKFNWASTERSANAKVLLDSLRPYLSKLPMIRFVGWVSSDAILVAWQGIGTYEDGIQKGQPRIFFDLWRRSHKVWQIVDKDLADFNPLPDMRIADNSNMLSLAMNFISTGDLGLVKLQSSLPEPVDSLTFGEMRQKREKFLRGNDPAYWIYRYRILIHE